MRIHPVQPARTVPCPKVRKTLATLGVAGFITGMSMFGVTGTAAAVTATDSCSGTVVGTMGEKVSVHGKSVKEIVRAAAKEKATGTQYLFVWPDKLARDIEARGAMEVGKIPKAATGSIKGEVIGEVVGQALEGESGLGTDPEDTLAHIEAEVADACGISLKASDYVKPTTTSNKPESSKESAGPRGGAGGE
ncbi:MAG: hypothetical protein ACRDQ7_12865, partial [Haloechinothrix sp.]